MKGAVRISSVLFSILLGILSAGALAYEANKVDGTDIEIKWSTSSVTYYLNTLGGPSGASDALRAALQTWTEVNTSSFTFVYGGTNTSASCGVRDGSNMICFGAVTTEGVLARNLFWYSTSTGRIIDSDITFNTNYTWKTDGSSGAYDMQNVATHELGHSLSLADLYAAADSEKTMYGYSGAGETKKRTLDQDDIDGISYLYPANGASYTLSGKVTSGGSGLSGVTVALSGAQSVSTATDSYGGYLFTGLSAGTYTVTPTKTGYAFTPSSLSVTVSGAKVTGKNFTAKPSAPAGLSASDGAYADKTELSWNSVSSAASYAVYRAETSSGKKLKVGSSRGTSFNDTSGSSGKSYSYFVTAVTAGGVESDYSSPDSGYRKAH
ncbi:MAG: matrixin family metalloprotease [Thermodesulfovibrionales bacterium]